MSTEVKICGLCRPQDARVAAEVGADYLGVVFAPGPRRREVEQAREIWRDLSVRRVGVFVDPERREAVRIGTEVGLAVVQLHGSEPPDFCRSLRAAAEWRVWKAVSVTDRGSVAEHLETYADAVDGLLLEGWSSAGRGGVGAGFEWDLAAEAREDWPERLSLIVAGGLDADNVGEAVAALRPDIVDVSSGVEAKVCAKDPEAVATFVRNARMASGG